MVEEIEEIVRKKRSDMILLNSSIMNRALERNQAKRHYSVVLEINNFLGYHKVACKQTAHKLKTVRKKEDHKERAELLQTTTLAYQVVHLAALASAWVQLSKNKKITKTNNLQNGA